MTDWPLLLLLPLAGAAVLALLPWTDTEVLAVDRAARKLLRRMCGRGGAA